MNTVKTLEYFISEIKTNQFAIFENETVAEGEKSVNSSFSYGIDPVEKKFSCIVDILFRQTETPLIKIQTEAVYIMSDESFSELLDDNRFVMPEKIVIHFTDLLIGATRGILASKLESTPFRQLILPEIRLNEIVTTPLVITIGKN